MRAGRWVGKNGGRPGEFVFFNFPDNVDRIQHVGWFDESIDTRRFRSIEGNTSRDNNGSQSQGGGVWRRTRNRSYVVGFGRPDYAASGTPVPHPIEEDRMICTPPWLPRIAGNRVQFYELRPVSAKSFIVVAHNGAPLVRQDGITPSGLPYLEEKSTTGHALGIGDHGDGVIVGCAGSGSYDVGRKP